MSRKPKRTNIDMAQLVGAAIFISVFVGLLLLGLFYNPDDQFSSSFFEDVANAIQWK